MINLVFNNFTSDKKFGRDFFYRIIFRAVQKLGLEPKKSEVSINLVGEARIKALNKKYRGKNKTTNVLSFPLDSKPLAKSAIIALGDIFICLPFAKKEAKRENISVEEKLSWLGIHGFLHLLGYDHERSEDDKQEMERLEKKILGNNESSF